MRPELTWFVISYSYDEAALTYIFSKSPSFQQTSFVKFSPKHSIPVQKAYL